MYRNEIIIRLIENIKMVERLVRMKGNKNYYKKLYCQLLFKGNF